MAWVVSIASLVAAGGPARAVCIEEGAGAHRAGRLALAVSLFRAALEEERCRRAPWGPMVRYSLGRALLDLADEAPGAAAAPAACEAVEHFRAALAESTDADVKAVANEQLGVAIGRCRAAEVARLEAARLEAARAEAARAEAARAEAAGRAAEPVTEEPMGGGSAVRRRAESSPDGMGFGPRIEAGIAGLAWGRLPSAPEPGMSLGLGLTVDVWSGARARLSVEPTFTLASLRYRDAVWRWMLVEGAIKMGWRPWGGRGELLVGGRIGWVPEAREQSAFFDRGGLALDVSPLVADALAGVGWGWQMGSNRIRLEVTGGLGVLRLNPADDAVGWHGYRAAMGSTVLF